MSLKQQYRLTGEPQSNLNYVRVPCGEKEPLSGTPSLFPNESTLRARKEVKRDKQLECVSVHLSVIRKDSKSVGLWKLVLEMKRTYSSIVIIMSYIVAAQATTEEVLCEVGNEY